MKLTLSWLKEYLETDASLEEIAAKLNSIGLEVDGIEDPAKAFAGFVVGEVVEAEQHPNADKLQCLVVDTGIEKLKVVCGAPNAAKGLKGVFAPAGSYIPGLDVKLKKTKIRGEESNGMMCSEKELCLSDEHKGIIALEGEFKTGMPAAEALGLTDPVIEVDITPDRGDCAAVYGIARDLAAAGLGALKALSGAELSESFESPVTVSIKDSAACGLFIGRYIKGVKNGPSPKWLQDRLKAVGQKPISALVDITNYFTLALARPLHVYDADKLKGNIHVRFAKDGETLEALDENEYKLDSTMSAICDDSGVLGLGGIIGGTPSSVDENTTNVFLECAYFNPDIVRDAGQKLMIDSDAKYRFERGIDAAFSHQGAELAAQMIVELCGGEVSKPSIAGEAPDITSTIQYNPERVKTLGGCDVDTAQQKTILEGLGFKVDDSKDTWTVVSPSWRHDIDNGEEDLVEEVLRIYGYDNIPSLPVQRDVHQDYPKPTAVQARLRTMRTVLASRDLFEAVTWSFMDQERAGLFGANDNPNKDAITLLNPISEDLSIMRPSALPNLIEAAGRNADRGRPNAALFEVGRNYISAEAEGQFLVVSGIRCNLAEDRHWAHAPRKVDLFDAKTDVVAALTAIGVKVENLQVVREAPGYYHPGRSAALKMGKNVIAYFGEVHPSVLDKMKRDEVFVAFEIFVENIPAPKKKSTNKGVLTSYALQPVSRDFAFVVDEDVLADKLLRAVKSADKKLITGAEVFDVYAGKGMEEGKKSIAFSITLQPIDKTLTDEEIAEVSKKVVASVEKETGGVLRG